MSKPKFQKKSKCQKERGRFVTFDIWFDICNLAFNIQFQRSGEVG
jgi:hypothetical protein